MATAAMHADTMGRIIMSFLILVCSPPSVKEKRLFSAALFGLTKLSPLC